MLTSQRAIEALKSKDEQAKNKDSSDFYQAESYHHIRIDDDWVPDHDNNFIDQENEVTFCKLDTQGIFMMNILSGSQKATHSSESGVLDMAIKEIFECPDDDVTGLVPDQSSTTALQPATTDVVNPDLPVLTDEMLAVINQALGETDDAMIISENRTCRVTRTDIRKLTGLTWLNDEVNASYVPTYVYTNVIHISLNVR